MFFAKTSQGGHRFAIAFALRRAEYFSAIPVVKRAKRSDDLSHLQISRSLKLPGWIKVPFHTARPVEPNGARTSPSSGQANAINPMGILNP